MIPYIGDHNRFPWDDLTPELQASVLEVARSGRIPGLTEEDCRPGGTVPVFDTNRLAILVAGPLQGQTVGMTSMGGYGGIQAPVPFDKPPKRPFFLKKITGATLSLNVSGCTALKTLYCNNNNALTSLDVSQNTALTGLYCYNNALTALDVSKNAALTFLNCSDNHLTALDVSKKTKLKTLDCRNNALTTLDVSGCIALMKLYCCANKIAELRIYTCPKLVSAYTDANGTHETRTATINETEVTYILHLNSDGELVVDPEVKIVAEKPPVEILSLTRSGDVFTFKQSGEIPAGAKLIAAAYDAGGRMLGVKVCADLAAESFTFAVPETAAVKAFLVDQHNAPLCEPKTAK